LAPASPGPAISCGTHLPLEPRPTFLVTGLICFFQISRHQYERRIFGESRREDPRPLLTAYG
jgi:hypothetical protein